MKALFVFVLLLVLFACVRANEGCSSDKECASGEEKKKTNKIS